MAVLFFDTETTGLPRKGLPDTHEKQPMPVQLGLKLDDKERNERGTVNTLIRPEGRWTIEPKAAEITGITNPIADQFGTSLENSVELFLDSISAAEYVVAHNIWFDVIIMRRAVFVYYQLHGLEYEDPFKGKRLVCTMLASMDHVKATPKRNGKWKWPKLSETILHFFNEELEGAHDALNDVRGCARVYYHMLDTGLLNLDGENT